MTSAQGIPKAAVDDRRWTRARIEHRLRAARSGRARGDHDLNPEWRGNAPGIAAAVLVPIVDHADGLTVLLTERNGQLNRHAGQISFPGGRIEADDGSPEAAALRETREEVGLAPEHIAISGRLDGYATRTGFDVTPVVGFVTPPLSLVIDENEVADVFEVPLVFVLDNVNYQSHRRRIAGVWRSYYALSYGDRYIWGATAGMLMNLQQVLRDS